MTICYARVRAEMGMNNGRTLRLTQIQEDLMSCGEERAIWEERAYRDLLAIT